MSIAALLRRTQAQLGAAAEWPVGAAVQRTIEPRVRGRVLYVLDAWVFWRGEDGRTYASRPAALRAPGEAGGRP